MMNFYELDQKIQILKEVDETEPEERAGPYYPPSPQKSFLDKVKDALTTDVLAPVLGRGYDQGMKDGLYGIPLKDSNRKNERYFKGWIKGNRIYMCKKHPHLC